MATRTSSAAIGSASDATVSVPRACDLHPRHRRLHSAHSGTRCSAFLGLYISRIPRRDSHARLLKSTVLRSKRSSFMLENAALPLAHRAISRAPAGHRSKVFLRRAGT